jgi:hypothetical protein
MPSQQPGAILHARTKRSPASKEEHVASDIQIEIELAPENEEEVLVHEWRAEQLTKLGVSTIVAHAFASLVDWHDLARLVNCGCPPDLAVEIVR